MKKISIYTWGSGLISLSIIALVVSFFFPLAAHSQSGGVAITGYAWSDTIGWIDLNCANSGVCGANPFGLSVASDGTVSGYAWSENVGWVSGNSGDLTGCPTAPCTATLSPAAMSGWLKVLSGNDAQNGGWDGFISLNGGGYGITYSAGNFAGYAWGDTNIGWVDFQYAHSVYNTCAATAGSVYTCANTQTIVRTDTNASCQVTVTNTTCTAPQFCSSGSPVCLWPAPAPTPTGTFTGNLEARPKLVPKNGSTTIAWNIANVTSCTVIGTNGDSWTGVSSASASCVNKSGTACVSGTISSQTLFTLSCVALDSSNYRQTQTVNVVPTFEENCNAGDVRVNGKCAHP